MNLKEYKKISQSWNLNKQSITTTELYVYSMVDI